jgi:hypothetical protein
LDERAVLLGEADVRSDVLGETGPEVPGAARGLQVATEFVEAVRGDRVEDGLPVAEVS